MLAFEVDASISVEDFHTLNRCLDNAIGAAVTAWTGDSQTDAASKDGQRASKDGKLGASCVVRSTPRTS